MDKVQKGEQILEVIEGERPPTKQQKLPQIGAHARRFAAFVDLEIMEWQKRRRAFGAGVPDVVAGRGVGAIHK